MTSEGGENRNRSDIRGRQMVTCSKETCERNCKERTVREKFSSRE